MANTPTITDEVMEFLRSEVFNAYASGDILSYTAKNGAEYALKITQVFGSDDPELNDGFHAFGTVLLDENGDETDQTVLVTRGSSAYPDCYADMDGNACGWPIFMEHKDEILSWYNDQKDAGKEVSFTGVSLGGVLSQMFSGYIHQETGDTLKSVVTFSALGIEQSITYEGVTYDFSGNIAETVHHYLDSGDTMMQMGSYYIEGDIYLYGCNYYLDQAGDSGNVVRFKDYWLRPHSLVKYLLSDEYSTLPQAVFIKEMKSSDMTGSWSPLSVTVDEIPEGIENTNNAVITTGSNTYVFNKAYAEIVLSMGISMVSALDINYCSKYVPRQKWEEMRGTEEGRQDFLGTSLVRDFTSDINVGISGSFSQGGKDYAVITLTGKTEQGREFLYSFSDGCFLEIEEVISNGNWQDIAGAQTYTVEFDELAPASDVPEESSESAQDRNYSTEVTDELFESMIDCDMGHSLGDIFEYTSKEGVTWRLKYTELYGSDDPKTDDGFHAAGLVLLDVDGVTETDEHILIFRGTYKFPDAIAGFYKDPGEIQLFAAHTQDVLAWYEKYEDQKITFSGGSLGCALSQFYAGWLVNDEGKDKLKRLVGFWSPRITKETTYEGTTYHFITDETVAESVDYYRHDGDIIAGCGHYYQQGTVHVYGSNAQLDQANGVRLHEYIGIAHATGTYLKGGDDALIWLGDFDTGYFDDEANYSDLAVEVSTVPEGLEKTNIEAVTCGDKTYLFNTELADVALTFVSYDIVNYDETLEDFFEDASLFTCSNHWEGCRGTEKQETLARLILYDNTSDIEISTRRGLTLGGKDYVELANTGSSWACNFFYNFNDREFVAGYDLDSASSLGEQGGVTFSINGDGAAVALAGEVVTVEAEKVTGYYVAGFTSEDVTITGNQFTMPEGDVTITANYAPEELKLTMTGDFIGQGSAFQLMTSGTAVIRNTETRTDLAGRLENVDNWSVIGTGDFNGSGTDGLLWLDSSTGKLVMQNDMTSFDEVNNKTSVLGIVLDGFTAAGTGDFSRNGMDGALIQCQEVGDISVSTSRGLACFAREKSGDMFVGWLGALVDTWKDGVPLKGDLSSLTAINQANYQYETVAVGDFNGDGRDDVMFLNTMPGVVTQGSVDYTITGSGDVFTFLTGSEEAIKRGDDPTLAYSGRATDGWTILGVGDFDCNCIADVLLSNGSDLVAWKMSAGQRQSDFAFGSLADGDTFAGIADVNNDGTDDLIIRTASTEQLTAWTVKDGKVTGTLAIV